MRRSSSNATAQLDAALDAAVAGDLSRLTAFDAETAGAWNLLDEWATLGGLDGFDVRPMAETGSATGPAPSRPHERLDPMMTSPPLPLPVPSLPAPTRRRPATMAMNALAWLLIVVIGGGAIWGLWPHFWSAGPEQPTFAAFQPAATPEAETDSPGVVNWGGDAGHTWVLGDTQPNTFGPEVLANFSPPSSEVVSSGLIVGDRIIYTTLDASDEALSMPGVGAYHTMAVDLKTRALAWEAEFPLLGPFASNGEVIAGFIPYILNGSQQQFQPALIDARTGQLVQTYFLPTAINHPPDASLSTVIDGRIAYFADASGSVVALDLETHEMLWASMVGGPSYGNVTPSPFSGSRLMGLVVVDGHVFVMRPSMTVVRLDPQTGEVTGSFNLIDDFQQDFHRATLQGVGNKLVIAAYPASPDDSDAAPTKVIVYGATSLEVFAQSDLPRLQSNLVVTLEWIYAIGAITSTDDSYPLRINPVTGETTYLGDEALLQVEPDEPVGISLASITLLISAPVTGYALTNVESGMPLVSVDIASSTSLVPDAPPLLWGNNVIFLDMNGGIHMLTSNAPDGPDQT